ncbi:MAG: DNA polymerase III subunit beta [Prevotellaceae bacterium]|jgi:DNA polymerase-3 subunit beta|nr:DNA polymerase III subunit beta [Prevotellaceae bacterium]
MKFIVSSTDLLSHLQSIGRVISSKNTMQILDNFLFRIEGNILTITASDLETTMETSLHLDTVEKEGAVAITARLLTDFLKEFPEQPLSFTVDSNHAVEITWDNGKFNIPGAPADDYPTKPALPVVATQVSFPTEVLLEGLNRTLFATADDELRPVMNGIYFDLQETGATLVASDSHKLMYYKRTDIVRDDAASFILPKKPAALLKSSLAKINDTVTLAFDDKNAVFTFPGYSLTCRLVEGNYPAYRSVIPSNNENKVLIDRVEILSAVRRVSVGANQASNLIKLKVADNRIVVSAQDLDFSVMIDQEVNCRFDGHEIEIGFKSTFLSEILANLSSTNVSLELSDPSRAGLILPVESEDEHEETLALLMPMTIGV